MTEDDIDLLKSILNSLDHMHTRLDRYDAVMNKLESLIESAEPHMEKVAPMIDQISKHPMLRMLGVK